MTIAENQAAATFEFQGRIYHFCSERCRRHFEAHPGWYVPVRDDGSAGTLEEEPGVEGRTHGDCHVDPIEKEVDLAALQEAAVAILRVSGMGCPTCATRVRNGLFAQSGVLGVQIRLHEGLAEVAFDPSQVGIERLERAVALAGNDGRHEYRATLVGRAGTGAQSVPATHRTVS